MIEICYAQVGQPVYHVKEPDAPELYALVSFNCGQADPERDVMTVGYSPNEDIGGLTPINDLIDRVASHILLRTHESVVSS